MYFVASTDEMPLGTKSREPLMICCSDRSMVFPVSFLIRDSKTATAANTPQEPR